LLILIKNELIEAANGIIENITQYVRLNGLTISKKINVVIRNVPVIVEVK